MEIKLKLDVQCRFYKLFVKMSQRTFNFSAEMKFEFLQISQIGCTGPVSFLISFHIL